MTGGWVGIVGFLFSAVAITVVLASPAAASVKRDLVSPKRTHAQELTFLPVRLSL